jgi:hypothetical protein
MFYRELGLGLWNGGRWCLSRMPKLSWPRFGSKVVNMTGPQAGSYDENGLPW